MIERPESAMFGSPRDPVLRGMVGDGPLGQSTQPCNHGRLEPRFHRVEDIGHFSRNRSRGLIGLLGHRDLPHSRVVREGEIGPIFWLLTRFDSCRECALLVLRERAGRLKVHRKTRPGLSPGRASYLVSALVRLSVRLMSTTVAIRSASTLEARWNRLSACPRSVMWVSSHAPDVQHSSK